MDQNQDQEVQDCLSCHQPNRTPHYTQYDETRSCCPLCQSCWQMLEAPENRWPYYAQHIDNENLTMEQAEKIIAAVKDGK